MHPKFFMNAPDGRVLLTLTECSMSTPSSTHALPKIGDRAPSFSLPSTLGKTISNADLKGSTYVLAFYPGDFTPVCGDQLSLYSEGLSKITALGASIFGVSVDSLTSHVAFAKARNLRFPLLSDFHPKGAASQAFGSYNEETGRSKRNLFVIDADGVVRWSHESPDAVNPGMDGILAALRSLNPEAASRAPARPSQAPAGHFKGSADAKATLVEYGDYECPYCGMAYQELKRVFAHFGDSLRFEFRNFPLANMHPHAEMAAEAAEAAGAQGKFWEMHDALYETQRFLSPQLVSVLAQRLGLDLDRFAQEVNSHAYLPKIKADLEAGLEAGVNGTPCFFINGRRHEGDFQASTLIQAIEQAGG
jgi:peroxiredoxin/predicted DsbA family dithiol-disulfide isomerase